MWRCLYAIVLLWSALARAEPHFERCADAILAREPNTLLAEYLHGKTDWDEREQRALGSASDALDILLLVALDANDPKRVAHVAALMESTVKTQKPASPADQVKRESLLAQVQALAGHDKEARAHLAAAVAKAAGITTQRTYVQRMLWTAALRVHDDAAAARAQTAYFQSPGASEDFVRQDAGSIAFAGVGRGLLPICAEREDVCGELAKGAKGRHDWALFAEAIAHESPHARWQDLWEASLEGDMRPPALVAAVKAALPLAGDRGLDDPTRVNFVEAAAAAGLGAEARPIAAQIKNPWIRAEAEAFIAVDLAMTDKPAAIALARASLARGKSKPSRQADRDARDRALEAAGVALARAGRLDEGKRASPQLGLGDQLIGLRDDPKAFAARWATESNRTHAWFFAHAAKRDPSLGDPSYLAPYCTD